MDIFTIQMKKTGLNIYRSKLISIEMTKKITGNFFVSIDNYDFHKLNQNLQKNLEKKLEEFPKNY